MDIQQYMAASDSSNRPFKMDNDSTKSPGKCPLFFLDFTKANFYRIKDLIYIRFFIFYQSQYLNSL